MKDVVTLTVELARYESAVARVEGLHTERDGRCMHCVEWCECEEYRDCPHGFEPWPCPTIRQLNDVLGAADSGETAGGEADRG